MTSDVQARPLVASGSPDRPAERAHRGVQRPALVGLVLLTALLTGVFGFLAIDLFY